jgi:hypothetical protein
MDVYAIAGQKHVISRQDAIKRIKRVLEFYDRVPQNRGWLYHFHDADGKAIFTKEVSSVDTALFYHGARQATQRLQEATLIQRVENSIGKIDRQWMIDNSPSKKLFCHGLANGKFLPYEWDDYNEGALVYSLFGMNFIPRKITYDLPLFAYYFPLCYMQDKRAEEHLRNAIEYQKGRFGYYGVTSCDTREGYCFYPTEYISPIALYSVEPFYPDANNRYRLPLAEAVHVSSGWQSTDEIGIDVGAAIELRNPPHR